jgi:hypothetical protein
MISNGKISYEEAKAKWQSDNRGVKEVITDFIDDLSGDKNM